MKRRTLLTWLGLGGAASLTGGAVAGRNGQANPYYEGPESDHFDGRLFFNPDGRHPASFTDLLRWQLGGGKTKWPAEWPSPHPQAKPQERLAAGDLRVTMVGHASLLLQAGAMNILTDPVWSERVSPVSFAGPRRVSAPGIRFEDLPPIDLVLVSHNHYDHLDAATLARLVAAHKPRIVTPLGNDTLILGAAPDADVAVMDWGDRIEVADAVVHCEPAHHWSARGTFDRRMALWAGFVIETPAGQIFFAGDTGFHGGRNYRHVAQKHNGFRLAILPIGAYEPRWFMEPQHQNPEEALEGMRLSNSAFAAGCHWGTFHLTNEPIDEPRERLHAALDLAGVARERFRAMLPGEAWDVPAVDDGAYW